MPPSKHLYNIDLIRLIASFSIITIHTASNVFFLFPALSPPALYLSTFLSFFFRWSTPLFIIISGYLLLNFNRTHSTKEFYLNRLRVLLIPLIFWNIFYFIFSYYLGRTEFTIFKFFKDVWNAGTYYHLYFLFLIVGLYAVTPLLNKYLHRLNLNILVPILFLISQIYLVAYTWFGLPQLNIIFVFFIPYLGYYFAGVWLSRQNISLPKILGLCLILLPIIGVIFNTKLVSLFGVGDKSTFLSNRLSLLVAISGAYIFSQLIRIPNSFFEKFNLTFIKPFSGFTMGIYLIHPFILELFVITKPFSQLLKSSPTLWMLGVIPLVFFLSLLFVMIIKKIPYLSRIV